jgi:hypothetical protein
VVPKNYVRKHRYTDMGTQKICMCRDYTCRCKYYHVYEGSSVVHERSKKNKLIEILSKSERGVEVNMGGGGKLESKVPHKLSRKM